MSAATICSCEEEDEDDGATKPLPVAPPTNALLFRAEGGRVIVVYAAVGTATAARNKVLNFIVGVSGEICQLRAVASKQ